MLPPKAAGPLAKRRLQVQAPRLHYHYMLLSCAAAVLVTRCHEPSTLEELQEMPSAARVYSCPQGKPACRRKYFSMVCQELGEAVERLGLSKRHTAGSREILPALVRHQIWARWRRLPKMPRGWEPVHQDWESGEEPRLGIGSRLADPAVLRLLHTPLRKAGEVARLEMREYWRQLAEARRS